MKMFADYIKERGGKDIVYSDKGFATYSFNESSCYIEEIYVVPESRKSGEASRLTNEIAEIAKERGYKMLTGSVCPTANGSTESMKALLAYGFKLVSSTHNFIILSKEIGVK
jgi:predicted GNAT family acetyltransferase